jgi:hypothetical protein
MIANFAQGIHDDLPLWRQAIPLFADTLVVMNLVMGQSKTPYCKSLQLQSDCNKELRKCKEDDS